MRKLYITILSLLVCLSVKSQQRKADSDNQFMIVSYNVENLFDTIDAPDKYDEDFTPEGKYKWDSKKYEKKLESISKVISAIKAKDFPEIVGLVEIENENVLEELVKQEGIKKAKYQYIHYESPDSRGIDVALLYRPEKFKVVLSEPMKVGMPTDINFATRDILYIKGIMPDNDTLHVLLNHWSSRRGGKDESEPKRLFQALLIRSKIESIQSKDSKAKIIIMGDFNDNPTDKSLNQILSASNDKKNDLYNLMYEQYINGEGTYNYKGIWDMIDNMIVTKSLLIPDDHYFTLTYEDGRIFKPDWLSHFKKDSSDYSPDRTYLGDKYFGGYSDHYPIYCVLKRKY